MNCCNLSAITIHLRSSQYDILDIMVFVMFFGGIGLPCTTKGLLFHPSGCYHIRFCLHSQEVPVNIADLCCFVLCVVDIVTFQFCIQWAQRSAIFSDVSNF